MKTLRSLCIFVCFVLINFLTIPVNLTAADFGVVLNQNASYGNAASADDVFEYRAGLVPRFSTLIGENSSFFMSASVTVTYKTEEDVTFVPELLRTEFFTRFGAIGLSAGRVTYSDPLGFIVNGLFDGVQLTYASRAGRFGVGAWYTGFLYKKSANITMTGDDLALYDEEFKYDDFTGTYFAPKRLIASADWDNPGVADFMRLRAALTAQFDFTDGDTKLNSQYASLKAGIPAGRFLFEAGGSFEMTQFTVPESVTETLPGFAFAGEAGIHWTLPASFNSRLSLTVSYGSGKINEQVGAFIPVSTKYYGEILQAKLGALTVYGIGYSARFTETLGVSLSALYFIRNDKVTPNSYTMTSAGEGKFLLGGEGFARIIWSPVSDWQFILGGGAFVPSLGDNWVDEPMKWKCELTAVLSL